MLVKLNEILAIAEEKKYAIGAFNTPNLECVTAVVSAAEKLNVPVILAFAEFHEDVTPLSVITPIMLHAARTAKVPVCVHLDHCESLDYMKRALELGFTSVMYDGSLLPYEENVENTKKAVAMAKSFGVDVEAEIGRMPAREGGDTIEGGPVYTDPDIAVQFCEATGIDALAPSFGTAHGIYKSKPVLDLERVRVIAEKTGKPLVMHGGSGVCEEDYRTAIKNGIRKVNYYTYMSKAGVKAVEAMLASQDVTFLHDLMVEGRRAMQENAETALRIFANL